MTTEWWNELKSITLNKDAQWPQRLAPESASDDFVAARRELAEAESALRDHVEEVARLRRALPVGGAMPDYELKEGEPARSVRLSELFGDHETLVVYHLMFHADDDQACPMCSLWVDGLHGVSHHLTRRTGFAVVAPAPLSKLNGWAQRRGWDGLRVVSCKGTSFNADLEIEGPRGGLWPGISVFARNGDGIRHVVTECAGYPDGSGRGIDLVSPVWQLFDLLPQGRGDWLPDNDYPGRSRGASRETVSSTSVGPGAAGRSTPATA